MPSSISRGVVMTTKLKLSRMRMKQRAMRPQALQGDDIVPYKFFCDLRDAVIIALLLTYDSKQTSSKASEVLILIESIKAPLGGPIPKCLSV